MQDILSFIRSHLDSNLASILLKALQNSNNEKFFNFVLENIQVISTWLNSDKFKEKYLKTKHAYPPLIDPDFIDTDTSRHCAELAWDLNLPLPKRYKFIYISPHGVGAAAFLRYLNQCCNVICFASWMLPYDTKERYCIHYMHLNDDKISQYAINISEINLPYFDKYLSLIDFNSSIICGVRDPIGILKHCCGRDWSKVERNYIPEFNLSYDWRHYINFLTHQNREIKIDLQELENGVFIISYLLQYFNQNNIHYLDMEEISLEKALNTMNSLALKFDFTPPHESSIELFKIKEFKGYIRYLFPITLYANLQDINNVFDIHSNSNQNELIIDKTNSIAITLHRMHINHEKINIIKEIITSDLCDDMGVYINKNDFERLKQQELLFKAIKRYLYDFLCAIKTTIEHTESNMIKEDDILAYFDKNQSIIPQFHDIFQKDFHHLKQYRPDIINSWKYYQKFEKMYKNIQNNNHKQK